MGSKSSTETTTSKPLEEQYAQLKNMWGGAENLYNNHRMDYYGESTVGGRDDLSIAARDATAQLGSTPDYTDSAKQFLGQVMGGDFMGGPGQNPMLDEKFKVMSDRIGEQYNQITAPSTATRFAGAGRSGSDAYRNAMGQNERNLGESLGRTATDVYYGDYNNRMQDRMQGLGATTALRGMEYGDIGQMRGQGAIEEQYGQRQLDDSINRFNFNQQETENRFDRYAGRVGQPNSWGTNVKQTTGGGGVGAGILGMLGKVGGAMFTGGGSLAAGGLFGR